VYVFLVTLIQGEFLGRVTRRLQGDLKFVCGIVQGNLWRMNRVLQDESGLFRRALALALARRRVRVLSPEFAGPIIAAQNET